MGNLLSYISHLPLQCLQLPTQRQGKAGSWFSAAPRGQLPPTLLESIQLLLSGPDGAGQRFPLSIQLRKRTLESLYLVQRAPPSCVPTLCLLVGTCLHPCWQESLAAAAHEGMRDSFGSAPVPPALPRLETPARNDLPQPRASYSFSRLPAPGRFFCRASYTIASNAEKELSTHPSS